MSDDYEYFRNKRADRVYLSRSLASKTLRRGRDGELEEVTRPFRIVSKVIDSAEGHQFFKDGKQISLRITDGGRQEIVAKFYEDTREIRRLTIQRYSVKDGSPHKTYFTFSNEEIATLYNFIANVELLPLKDGSSAKLDDKFVESIVLTRDQALRLLAAEPELVEELTRHQLTAKDVALLGQRRKELDVFNELLSDAHQFSECKHRLGPNKRDEDVWQDFFERNTWIFGYGLNYLLNTPLEGEKLEQIVKGHNFVGAGKRVDALLKTQGLISSLSFGEIKTHKTRLLKQVSTPYRGEAWQVSDELAGGVAQVHRAVQTSLGNIQSRTDINARDGSPTGEQVFFYRPRSFLVVGSLAEFQTAHGINEEKYSSFELFRRHVSAPEIITFDELYERARFIVESSASPPSQTSTVP